MSLDSKLIISSRDKLHILYEQYSSAMFHAAMEITRNVHDSEDAVQQACISIFEVIDKVNLDEERMCRSYAILVCERKALDIIKRRNRRKEVALNDALHGLNFDFTVESSIDKALQNLKPRDREALLIRYAINKNIEDTARMLELSVNACYKLIERAKVRLKKELLRQEREEK